MLSIYYYYKIGPLEKYGFWRQPNFEIFNLWKKDFLQIPGVQQYEVWLCGGFLEQQWETPDVDIILKGPTNLKQLEYIMIEGHAIAFYKYSLLIEIHFSNDGIFWPYEKVRTVNKIVLGDKIIQNSSVLINYSNLPDSQKLSKYLWKIKKKYPSEKQLKRINAGLKYDKLPIRLDNTKMIFGKTYV